LAAGAERYYLENGFLKEPACRQTPQDH
jgi:hypothetical protein